MDFDTFHSNLPESIEAIFYIHGGCTDTRPQPWMGGHQVSKCEDYARWAHSALQARWPRRAANIPLVRMDVSNFEAPFSLG